MTEQLPSPSTPTADVPTPRPSESCDCLNSSDLFRNRREITIRHGEDLYRLRLTKNGKLILHK